MSKPIPNNWVYNQHNSNYFQPKFVSSKPKNQKNFRLGFSNIENVASPRDIGVTETIVPKYALISATWFRFFKHTWAKNWKCNTIAEKSTWELVKLQSSVVKYYKIKIIWPRKVCTFYMVLYCGSEYLPTLQANNGFRNIKVYKMCKLCKAI